MKLDKASIAKMVVKSAIGITVSASIGTLIKSQKSLDTLIETYFEKNQTDPTV